MSSSLPALAGPTLFQQTFSMPILPQARAESTECTRVVGVTCIARNSRSGQQQLWRRDGRTNHDVTGCPELAREAIASELEGADCTGTLNRAALVDLVDEVDHYPHRS
jgi:hypothetical protein